jgi:hypothetical protein
MPVCEAEGCEREAAVELYIPWRENQLVCPAHARTLSRKDGIVPNPMDGHEDEWP